MHTLYNVCSVHFGVFSAFGDVMSTSGDVQYIMNTSGITMSTLGRYHEDTMSILGDIMSISGGYHEFIRGILSVHFGC